MRLAHPQLNVIRQTAIWLIGLAVVVGFGPAGVNGQAPVNTPLPVSNIQTTSATLNWNTNYNSCANINYGTTSASLTIQVQESTGGCTATKFTGNHSKTLTGLLPGTTYYYQIIPIGGGLPGMAQASFTTASGSPGPPPSPPGSTTATATITSVQIISTSTSNATVQFSFTTSLMVNGVLPANVVEYQISYGQTTAYGSFSPTSRNTAVTNTDILVTMDNLSPSTTYHFVIKLYDKAQNALLTTSADRAFTTASATGGGNLLLIQQIRTDCVNTFCNIYFSTTKPAKVQAGWGTGSQTGFTYPSVTPPEATFSSAFRSLSISGLSASTKYYYRLQATDAGGGQFTTSELSFTTSANAADHTFSTGSCSNGGPPVDIGNCLGTLLCTASGSLVPDCIKCGYVCGNTQTCRQGLLAGTCFDDLALNGAPTQCNNSTCYNNAGIFISPATDAKCYASWPRCNANTILKVRKDRGCNLWLSCNTSLQTDASSNGPGENLCLSLGACNSLSTNGQCNHYLPLGQCNNDPLRFCNTDADCQRGGTCNNPDPSDPTRALKTVTYQTPADITRISDLSGNVVAGLDWGTQGGANVIQGLFPWQLMRQIGGDAQIRNGDFEYRAPEVDPWIAVPEGLTPPGALSVDFENRDDGPNHVLDVEPITQIQTGVCQDTDLANTHIGEPCSADTECQINPAAPTATAVCKTVSVDVPFSGAASNTFNASSSEYYYAEARIRGEGGNPVVRMQFGHSGYRIFEVTNTYNVCSNNASQTCTNDAECTPGLCNVTNTSTTNSYVDVATSAAWQRVTIGPLRGLSGVTRLAFVCADKASCGKFQVDDVIVKPVLQVNSNPSYLTPSCRLFPKADSPSCDYADTNGVVYKGWKGYCLERDSQTGTCVSWWPVDIVKGESSIFGSEKAAGYQDRAPLFMCAESRGGHGSQAMSSTVKYSCGGNCAFYCSFAGAGICFSFDNPGGVGLTTAATGADLLVNKNYVYAFALTIIGVQNNFPFSSGTYTATAANNWTISLSDGQGDDLFVKLLWNSAGFLTSYQWFFQEAGAGSRGVTTTDAFIMKEACSKFVQVVDQAGKTSAFGARISSSVYKVPDLGYGLTADLTPFGGALAPDTNSNDITSWPILSAEQPDYITRPAPGQARSGSPYACNGVCDGLVCTVDPSNNCSDATKIRNCQQKDIDGNGIPDGGECIGVATSAANSKGLQTFNPGECLAGRCTNGGAACTSSIQCQTSLNAVGNNTFFGQERIKRLFTQTFGVWTDLRCSGATTKACNSNADCTGSGTCSVYSGKYALVPNSTPTFTGGASNSTANFVGWNPPTEICPANPAYQANSCTSKLQACTASAQVIGNSTTVSATETTTTKQEAMASALSKCGLSNPSPTQPLSTTVGVPINGTLIGPGFTACNGVSTDCPGGAGYQAGTIVSYTTFTLTSPCSFKNNISSCTGRCSSSSEYISASKPITAVQSRYLRPGYVPGSGADYCAIPPEVTNAKFVTGTATVATITGGSGAVGIKFNTTADLEQVPLGTIKIDWGDGIDEFAYPFAPRNDPARPHIFSHTYTLNRGDATHCATTGLRTTCDFPIKIQVIDSWGWANDATVVNNGPDVPSHGPTSAQWFNTGLKVHVEP